MSVKPKPFWDRVNKSTEIGACWMWTGSVDAKGYGKVRQLGPVHNAHRVAYRMTKGEIPARML